MDSVDWMFLFLDRERKLENMLTSKSTTKDQKDQNGTSPYSRALKSKLLDQKAQNSSNRIKAGVRKNLQGMSKSMSTVYISPFDTPRLLTCRRNAEIHRD